MATLHLTHPAALKIFAEKGKSTNGLDIVYTIGFTSIPLKLDTSYSLYLNKGLANEKIYTIGSGLTIIEGVKSIVWVFDSGALDIGEHKGYIVSYSNIEGVYLEIEITLILT